MGKRGWGQWGPAVGAKMGKRVPVGLGQEDSVQPGVSGCRRLPWAMLAIDCDRIERVLFIEANDRPLPSLYSAINTLINECAQPHESLGS